MVGIPYRDTVRARDVPYVNIAIIVINLAVFLYEVALSQNVIIGGLTELDRFIFEWGSIPACTLDWLGMNTHLSVREVTRCDAQPSVPLSALSSMFIHGGWLHLASNMLFLWIFGDNIEDAMGHARYGAFYLLCGLAATFAHACSDIESIVPAIGASGAISGIMGAYLVLYPRGSIYAFPFFFIPFPAWLFIGFYMVIQFNAGIASLGPDAVGAGDGVAYFAHIGGFLAGAALVLPFMAGRRRRRSRRRPGEEAW
jgi:membrane associated rhomboid family serine protease